MKQYLLLLALMFVVGSAGMSPATVSAAENPAAKVTIEPFISTRQLRNNCRHCLVSDRPSRSASSPIGISTGHSEALINWRRSMGSAKPNWPS